MHFGNVRTALFNFLLAKSLGGTFLLRIEDTDKARSDVKLTAALQEDLRWLGLDWNEGPEVGGSHGPYLQSERQAIYEEFYGLLQKKGLIYPCFCSEEQLTIARKVQLSLGRPPRYAGTCRNLSEEEIVAKLAQGLQPAFRFKIPENQKIIFQDMIKGEQCVNSSDIGDFIIRRTDGTAPFMFCNAIDDALMGVTHALRGEDHLTNTPRQLMILRALDLPEPHYGHMPLILGHDGAPLSKRHGSRSAQELRAQGFLSLALVNYLARLGHPYATDDLLGLDELAAHFSAAALSNSPAKFDEQQLHHWQKKGVAHLEHSSFCSWLDDATKKLVPVQKLPEFARAIQPNVILPYEAKLWAEIFFGTTDDLLIADDARQIIAATACDFYSAALSVLEQPTITEESMQAAVCDALKNQLHIKGKALFMPLRAALTGKLDGPHLAEIFLLLGKEEVKRRLRKTTYHLQIAG